ncbi:MAG TPA: hypothetical protein VN622_00245 [Clostridia bacterium]|nr:hypothetical protein [Clostridia bacterium]
MRRFVRLMVVLLCCSGWLIAHDSEPINTNFAAPFTRGAGNVQLKYQYLRRADLYEVLPAELEYGFAPRQQFSIGVGLDRLHDSGETYIRPGNLEVGYRLLLLGDNSRRFAVSINPEVELPTGDKRVAERSVGAGGTLNIDTHLLRGLWTHTNIGYETAVARIGEEREKNVIYNFAAMYEASEAFRPVIEIVGVHDLASDRTDIAFVPEAIFAPNHRWEIKVGMPVGLTSTAPSVGAQLALTWKFGARGRQ